MAKTYFVDTELRHLTVCIRWHQNSNGGSTMNEAKGSVQQYPAAMVNITNRCKNRDDEQEYSFILGFMGRK